MCFSCVRLVASFFFNCVFHGFIGVCYYSLGMISGSVKFGFLWPFPGKLYYDFFIFGLEQILWNQVIVLFYWFEEYRFGWWRWKWHICQLIAVIFISLKMTTYSTRKVMQKDYLVEKVCFRSNAFLIVQYWHYMSSHSCNALFTFLDVH